MNFMYLCDYSQWFCKFMCKINVHCLLLNHWKLKPDCEYKSFQPNTRTINQLKKIQKTETTSTKSKNKTLILSEKFFNKKRENLKILKFRSSWYQLLRLLLLKNANDKKFRQLSNEMYGSLWNLSYFDDWNALLATPGDIIEDSEIEPSL